MVLRSKSGLRATVGFLAMLAAALVCLSAEASLAPNYERLRELRAILDSPEMIAKLGNRAVEGIASTGNGPNYRVWTSDCAIEVNLVDAVPSGAPMMGPRHFAIRVGELRCR
jgi:hypothetical protein